MAVDLLDLARCIGAYRWAELTLFEALGGWAARAPEPRLKAMLATHGDQHAWHAELWLDRLPALAGLDPEVLTVAPSPDMARFAAVLLAPDGPESSIERLVGVYRVLVPRCIGAYTAHLAATNSITDGPTSRALKLVLRDELEEWAEGELAIHGMLTTAADVQRASRHQSVLEASIAAAGGIVGRRAPQEGG